MGLFDKFTKSAAQPDPQKESLSEIEKAVLQEASRKKIIKSDFCSETGEKKLNELTKVEGLRLLSEIPVEKRDELTHSMRIVKDYSMTPNEILGVSENASPDEIKQAYRDLAKKYHPDKDPGDPNADRRFKRIKGAYDFLSKEHHEHETENSHEQNDDKASSHEHENTRDSKDFEHGKTHDNDFHSESKNDKEFSSQERKQEQPHENIPDPATKYQRRIVLEASKRGLITENFCPPGGFDRLQNLTRKDAERLMKQLDTKDLEKLEDDLAIEDQARQRERDSGKEISKNQEQSKAYNGYNRRDLAHDIERTFSGWGRIMDHGLE